MVRGRTLAETDTASAPRVTVINQALAELCWPGENPIGKHEDFQGSHKCDSARIVELRRGAGPITSHL